MNGFGIKTGIKTQIKSTTKFGEYCHLKFHLNSMTLLTLEGKFILKKHTKRTPLSKYKLSY